jgi:hypothetical protein
MLTIGDVSSIEFHNVPDRQIRKIRLSTIGSPSLKIWTTNILNKETDMRGSRRIAIFILSIIGMPLAVADADDSFAPIA